MFRKLGGMMIAVGLLFILIAVVEFWKDAVNSFYFVSGVVMIVGGTIMNKLDDIFIETKKTQSGNKNAESDDETR